MNLTDDLTHAVASEFTYFSINDHPWDNITL